MPRFITLFVAAYWAAFFAILALAAIGEVTGAGLPFDMLVTSAGSPFHVSAGAPLSAILATGFLLVAVLFAWALATALFEGADARGEGDGVARIALGAAAGMMAVLLVVGIVFGKGDVLGAVSMQLVALLVSHVAILADAGRAMQRKREAGSGSDATARVVATRSAHASILARMPRRDPHPEKY